MSVLSISDRISAFSNLGDIILKACLPDNNNKSILTNLIGTLHLHNPWFSPEFVRKSLLSIADSLSANKLNAWLNQYSLPEYNSKPLNVGVIMAGNIPLVGFHDFLSVLITGNTLKAKLSSKDSHLLIEICRLLIEIEPALEKHIQLSDKTIDNLDAIIATGNDNSYRYFEYNYSELPHIFRKNRNSIAIIDKDTSDNDLSLLGDDIFDYYGLGCRSVSKLFLHKDFELERLKKLWRDKDLLLNNQPYSNNYRHQRALMATEGKAFFDTGNILLVEDKQINSPLSVLNYSYYNNISELTAYLELYSDKIQIIVGKNHYPFGSSQSPSLSDYADNRDTIKFLSGI